MPRSAKEKRAEHQRYFGLHGHAERCGVRADKRQGKRMADRLTRDYFRERAGTQNLEDAPKRGKIKLNARGRANFAEMDYEDLAKNDIRASDLEVRQWYNAHVAAIPEQIDMSQPLEAQARQAFGLRIKYREQARNLMADKEARKSLDEAASEPTFEGFICAEMNEKGMSRQVILEYMIGSAAGTNKDVNHNLGVEE